MSDATIHSEIGINASIGYLPVVVAIFLFVLLTSLFKWNRKRFNQLLAKITGPPMHSVIGTGFEFLGSSEKVLLTLMECARVNGPKPFKIMFPQFYGVVLMKPEDIQVVLNSSKALHKDRYIYDIYHNLFGDTLFTCSVNKWRKLRRIITPTFNSNILEQHNLVFNENSQLLTGYLKKELNNTQPFNILDYVAPNNLSIICQTAAGYNVENQFTDSRKYMEAMSKICELDVMRIAKPWLYPNFIFSIYIKFTGQQDIFETIKHLPAQILAKKKDEYAQKIMENKTIVEEDINDESSRKNEKIFVEKLLEINDPDVIDSDEDLKDEIMSLLVAGSDTTAVSLSYCILMLAIHQDVQDKVYDEIYDVLGDGDDTITIEDTYKLVYMEQVLKESLRLYPLVPLIVRKLEEDVKIVSENYVLRKGTSCIISAMATHHTAELYPNPSMFNPDNFSPENVEKRHKYSWIPFSGGPRSCLGYKYAMLSMKVQLSNILRNYSVHTDWKLSDVKLKFDIIIRSVHGYPITIRPRDRRPTFKRN